MRKIIITTFCVFVIVGFSKAQNIQPFKEGDRVIFVGNSITEAGFYEAYIWQYYMVHFPNRRIEIINAGIGGDVARQINLRFEDDVMARKPTVIALTFGMNDTGYFEYNWDNPEKFAKERVEESYKNYLLIEEKLKALPQIEKIIITSSPYDETMKNKDNYFPGKSKAMEEIVAFQKEAAKANNWGLVDFFYPMTAINLEGQKSNPEFTITGPDRIHPGNGGHLVMAYLFLKEQGLAGPVADVHIDSKEEEVVKSENANISNLTVQKDLITFDYLAESLPFPVDTVSRMWGNSQKQSDALDVIPFTEAFNREILKVSDLSPDKYYRLKIDGEEIGKWKGKYFQEGINLATLRNTPQYKQAWTIMNLNIARRNIEHKLREYYWIQFNYFREKGLLFDDSQLAVESARKASLKEGFVRSKMETYEAMRFPEIRQSYLDQMDLIVDKIYSINKPKNHKIIIELIKSS